VEISAQLGKNINMLLRMVRQKVLETSFAENLVKNTRDSCEFNPLEMTGDSLARNIEEAV
jgi:hypothetical protein